MIAAVVSGASMNDDFPVTPKCLRIHLAGFVAVTYFVPGVWRAA